MINYQLLKARRIFNIKGNVVLKCVKKFFKRNIKTIEFFNNREIPKWLNCDIVNGILILEGKPTFENHHYSSFTHIESSIHEKFTRLTWMHTSITFENVKLN